MIISTMKSGEHLKPLAEKPTGNHRLRVCKATPDPHPNEMSLWFRNLAWKPPVEVGSVSQPVIYIVFVHPNGGWPWDFFFHQYYPTRWLPNSTGIFFCSVGSTHDLPPAFFVWEDFSVIHGPWILPIRIRNLGITFTLPETNSSPLKIGFPKRKVVFQPSIFRGELLVWGRVCCPRIFPLKIALLIDSPDMFGTVCWSRPRSRNC